MARTVSLLAIVAIVCTTAFTAEAVSAKSFLRTRLAAKRGPRICCKAQTAACLACAESIDVEAYCEKKPSTQGCPKENQPAIYEQDDFKNGINKDLWNKLRGGGVDLDGCGTGVPALRFQATDADNIFPPSVETKSLDLFGGGELEFKLKFCDGTPMGGEFNNSNGVLVQYSTDGRKWLKLEAYEMSTSGEQLKKGFETIKISLNKKHHLRAVTQHTYFKFTQLKAMRGNWAIQGVVIRQYATATTAEDDFKVKKPGIWSYPPLKKEADGYKYALSPDGKGVAFSGSANMMHTMGLQRPFSHPLVVSATITKNDKCSSHFIALSRRTNFQFSWGKSPGEIKVGWNCNQRFIYSPYGSKVVKCPANGDYNLEFIVDGFNIILKDRENKCDTITLENTPFSFQKNKHAEPHFLFIGADQDKPGLTSVFKSIKVTQSEWDAKGRELTSVLISDKLLLKNSNNFQINGKSQRLYRFGPDGMTVAQMGDVAGSAAPMRSTEMYNLPLAIKTEVLSFDKTANYYIALSPDADFKWDVFPNKKALKFEWSCNSKSFVGVGLVKEARASKGECDASKCTDERKHIVEVKVFKDIITFKDDCCNMISVPNTWGVESPVHIFIGATRRDKSAMAAKFTSISVKGEERPPTIEDDTILMNDNFDFNDDKDTSQWTMSGDWKTTGVVSKKCGANEGSAMVMSNTGLRVATLKPLAFPHGAKLNFFLKFGGDSASCARMNPEKDDKVELRVSTDLGKTWKHLEQWKAKDMKDTLSVWNKMEFVLSKEIFPELAMASKVLIQFVQPGYNRPCCGHWALDDVRVTSLEIKGEPLFGDTCEAQNTAIWEYPKTPKNPNDYHYGFEDGLYFSGDPNYKTTMHTKTSIPANTIIKATIDRNEACSNHFIAISKKPELKFYWGIPKDAIYFMWNCKQKYVYAPDNRTSVDCAQLRKFKVIIRMEDGRVTFEDDKCAPIIMGTNSPLASSEYYLHVGAAQDRSDVKARFIDIRVERLPDKEKNLMETMASDNFEKKDPVKWKYPTLKDVQAAAARAKEEKAAATKAVEEAQTRLDDTAEKLAFGLDNVTKFQTARRKAMAIMEGTDTEYSEKQEEIKIIEKNIVTIAAKLAAVNKSVILAKIKYENAVDDLKEKKEMKKPEWMINKGEEAVLDAKSDLGFDQQTQRKYMAQVKDLKMRRDRLVASVDSPIRPIMVEAMKVEVIERKVSEAVEGLQQLKDAANKATTQAEIDANTLTKILSSVALGTAKQEDVFSPQASAQKSTVVAREAQRAVFEAIKNITEFNLQLNATSRKVTDMTFETLGALRRKEQRAEQEFKDAEYSLNERKKMLAAKKYKFAKQSKLLQQAKSNGNKEEAQTLADEVKELETTVAECIEKVRDSEARVTNASTIFQTTRNQTDAFEKFYQAQANALIASGQVSSTVKEEHLAAQQQKEAQDSLISANTALQHAANREKATNAGGLGYTVGYGALTIQAGMATAIRQSEQVEPPSILKASIDRKDPCDNQVVVLSTNPDFAWPIKKNAKSIAFRFACNTKTPTGSATVKMVSGYSVQPLALAKCDAKGDVDMIIKVNGGYATFLDNAGCSPLTVPLPFKDENFFVFIGAVKPKMDAKFVSFEVQKPEQPPKLSKNVRMFDDFDFHDSIWKTQWKQESTNGVVDQWCGSQVKADGNSLRMAREGARIATTKYMDLSNGGELEYSLRFGGGNGTHNAMCPVFSSEDADDCIVLEYCTRDCDKNAGEEIEDTAFLQAIPEEKIAAKGERTVKTLAAYPNWRNLKKWPIEDTSVNMKLPVTCCKDGVARLQALDSYGCHAEKTYHQAINVCRVADARLCTVDEVRQYKVRNVGCGYESRTWTSSGELIVQTEDPAGEDMVSIPHNKSKVYPGGWEKMQVFTVAEYGDLLSNGWKTQKLRIDWDNKYALSSSTSLRWRQCNAGNDAAINVWALDDIKVTAFPKPYRSSTMPRTILVNDKFDGDAQEKFNMDQSWWDMWRTTGRTDNIVVGGYQDVGQSLTFGAGVSHSTWQVAQTPPIDTVSDGGVTFAFYMKFGRKDQNVSQFMRGVEFQYSLDGPEGEFKVIKAWTDVTQYSDWTRQVIQIDNCSTPLVMSNSTIFRFMLVGNDAKAARAQVDIWAIDNFQALVGEHRIGWETGTDGLKAVNDKLFCYQEPRQLTPYSYQYVSDEQGGMEFSGDGVGKGSLRAHSSFQSPLSVATTLLKDDECSNHYVVFSPEKYYTFSWDREPNTFKFVWRCDRKVLITPYSTSSTACADLKTYKTTMRVTPEGVEFQDNGGCQNLRADMGMISDLDFYVYFGAVQKGETSQMTDRVLADNDGPQHNISEMRVDNSTDESKTADAEDKMKMNETNSPQLNIAFLEEPSVTSCAKALERTCGNVLGQMCLDCYVKNAKKIVVEADGIACNLKQAKSLCATNGHLDKQITVENEGEQVPSEKSGKPARFISMRIGDVGAFVNTFDEKAKCPSLRDCGLSSWTRWGACDKPCGDGLAHAYRHVIRPPKYGGLKCPSDEKLHRTRSCNVRSCDCHVSQWDDFSCCSQPCADPKYDPPIPGKQTRGRRVILPPLRNGMACPALNQTRYCNAERCAAVGIPPLGQTQKFLNMTKKEPFVAANRDDFCLQDSTTLGPYKYDFVSKTDPTGENFGVYFSGDSRGQSSLRGRKSFRITDLELETTIDKNSRCANHWIALSPDEFFTWNYEQEPHVIKAGWFCDYKFLITPHGNFTTKCERIRAYNLSLTIKNGVVTFNDDQCAPLKGEFQAHANHEDVYSYIGADHVAPNVAIQLAKPLDLEEINALAEQRGTMGPEGGSADGSQRHIMTKEELMDLDRNLTDGKNLTNGTSDEPTPPELNEAKPRINVELHRAMATGKSSKIENSLQATAKQFREANPGDVVKSMKYWLIHNPYRGTLSSDPLGPDVKLLRYNGSGWEDTSNPLPLEVTDEYIAASNGFPENTFIRCTDAMQVYAVEDIVQQSPSLLIARGQKYTGREAGARASSMGEGGITEQALAHSDDSQSTYSFVEKSYAGVTVEVAVPGRTTTVVWGAGGQNAPQKEVKVTDLYNVRCHWNKDKKIVMESYGCNRDKTFAQAMNICEQKGYRLPTVAEIKEKKTQGTGCGFDASFVWTSGAGEIGEDDATPPEALDKMKQITTVKIITGDGKGDDKDTNVEDRHSVRCCDDKQNLLPMEGRNGYGCNTKKTFAEAKDICDKKGFRLCTIDEVIAGRVKGTGCDMDEQTIWTSSGMTPDPTKGECMIVPKGKNYFFRGVDLGAKSLCCPLGAKLTASGACINAKKGETCFLYGNDLGSPEPHPCEDVTKAAGWQMVFNQEIQKDFRGEWQRQTVGKSGVVQVTKGQSTNCAPKFEWFKQQMLDSGLQITEYMIETVYKGVVKSQAVGKVIDITGDATFFGGVQKDDRGICLKQMKLLKPFGDKYFNAQISYGPQADSSSFCNYRTGKTSINSYRVADASAKDSFGADISFFSHRNDPKQFSICEKSQVFNTDNDDKEKRSIRMYVKGKPLKPEVRKGLCPGGGLELRNAEGDAKFCNKNHPCPSGYQCDTHTNPQTAVCCGNAINITSTLDGRLPLPGEPEKKHAVFENLRISGPGVLINKDAGAKECPGLIDCAVTPWGAWSECTKQCNGGNKTRYRSVLRPKEHGGRSCPALAQTTFCNLRSCDCGVTEFSEWSDCSKDCGGGLRTRSRRAFREPLADGALCPHLNETEVCNNMSCPFVGLPALGLAKTQLKNTPPERFTGRDDNLFCYENPESLLPYKFGYTAGDNLWFSGAADKKTTLRSRYSYQAPLRLDFGFQYSEWCDNHFIILTTDPYYTFKTGAEPDTIKFTYDCGKKAITSEFYNTSAICAPHLLPGVKATLEIDEFGKATFGDSICPSVSQTDERGALGNGKDFFVYLGANRDDASKPVAEQKRTIFSSLMISGEGSVINNFNKTTPCPGKKDCKVSPWTEFTNCTAPCDGGNHTRTRHVTAFPENGGMVCPILRETRPCNVQRCGKDCIVREWSEWGNCSEPCNGGLQWRVREIFQDRLQGSHFGIENCPALKEQRACNNQSCGKDCVVEEWGGWSMCSAPCGGGVKARTRKILSPAVKGHGGGKACPALEELKQCNMEKCEAKQPKIALGQIRALAGFIEPVALDDECSMLSGSCGRCAANPKCGYCPGTGQCMLGTVQGPTPRWKKSVDIPEFMNDPRKAFMYATNCSAWEFSFCSQNSCRDYTGCGECLKDQFCGWCPSTGKCLEGDEAGSSEIGEYCPRGWLHSPLHSGFGEDQTYDSILSPAQRKVQESHLNEFCTANTMETKMQIAMKMQDEVKRQERLRQARETCLPCSGTWPNCHCGQDVEIAEHKAILNTQVTRTNDEADGVDQTLPRNDTIKAHDNYGKPALPIGSICDKGAECNTGICSSHCCRTECENGICNEAGKCLCDEGWGGETCASRNVTDGTDVMDIKTKFNSSSMAEAGFSQKQLEDIVTAVKEGNATLLKLAKSEGSDPKRIADQHYHDAVGNFSGKIDRLGEKVDLAKPHEIDSKETRSQMEMQVASTTSFAKLEEAELQLANKKTELRKILTQRDETTDPNAKAKLVNTAENLSNEIQLIEASVAALKDDARKKSQVATESAQTLSADLAAQATKAKAAAEANVEMERRLGATASLDNAPKLDANTKDSATGLAK